MTVTGHSQGDVAVYSCLKGYDVDGTSIRKCQESGEWSSAAPNCTYNGQSEGV